MTRSFGRAPLILGVFASALLFIAFLSKRDRVTAVECVYTSVLSGVRNDLKAKLAHSEMLWTQSVKDREAMAGAYNDSSKTYL